MTAQHHPHGPSQVESFDPKSGGCAARIPAEGPDRSHAESGTLDHLAVSSGDLSILEGDEEALKRVAKAREFIRRIAARVDGEEFHEILLRLGDVNYGTCDYLKFSKDGVRAVLIDLKFGYWSVNAKTSLQLLNYAAAAFHTYPALRRISGFIFMARSGLVTGRNYNRRYFPLYRRTIEHVVGNAARAAKDPTLTDFTPNTTTCQFCARINCPARIALASALVNSWQKTPVVLSQAFSLTKLDLDQLGSLKRLGGALKAFCTAVDAEAKRRAIDEGKIIPGYELKERSGTRTILGPNIQLAASVIAETWSRLYPETELPVNEILMKLVEVGVGGIEKQLSPYAPRGEIKRAQLAIAEALEQAHLVTSTPQYILSAVKT